MDDLHQKVLGIAKVFHRFCEKQGVEYFMMSGTLLGAVRHKGFIPWDNDMDFGMTLEQFKKLEVLKDAFDKENEGFTMCVNGMKDYYYPYIKIVDNGTTVVERNVENKKFALGVYIDVFPFSGLPDNAELIDKALAKAKKIRVFYGRAFSGATFRHTYKEQYEAGRISLSGYVLRNIKTFFVGIFGKILGRKFIYRALRKNDFKYDIKNEPLIYDPDGINKRGVMPKEYILNGRILMDFEDTQFYGLKEYDKYLTNVYGDYMTPPKNTDRHSHEFVFLDLNMPFEEYKKR